jgi:hypothetical protein
MLSEFVRDFLGSREHPRAGQDRSERVRDLDQSRVTCQADLKKLVRSHQLPPSN